MKFDRLFKLNDRFVEIYRIKCIIKDLNTFLQFSQTYSILPVKFTCK